MTMDLPAVEVRFIGEPKGKGLFAVKPLKAGDVIFEESPLVCCQFAWNAAYGYLACDFCMSATCFGRPLAHHQELNSCSSSLWVYLRSVVIAVLLVVFGLVSLAMTNSTAITTLRRPLEGAQENIRRLTGKKDLVLPYPHCCPTNKESHTQCPLCGVQYCSSICRDKAWSQYHRTLCLKSHSPDPNHPLERLNEAWKYTHFPPETASVMILARMIATVQQADDPASALDLFMQFCHRTVNEEEEIAHKLLGEHFRGQLQTLRELMAQALYSDAVQQWLLPDGFQSLAALVGMNGQGVGTSPFSEWVKKVSELHLPVNEKQQLDSFIDQVYEDLNEVVGSFLNSEGSALYALQSACNHSCDPNAMPSFPHSNFQLVMCAVRDIAPGEEILISYLDDCVLERSRHSRQKILRENYLFTCHCPKCEVQAGDLDMTSEDESDDEDEDEGGQ